MAGLDLDTHTRISLIGTAERLHSEKVDRTQAIEQLRTIARGRTDLLAEAAGYFKGTGNWNAQPCYDALVDAGADPALIEPAADRTRRLATSTGHTTAGTTAPDRSPRWQG